MYSVKNEPSFLVQITLLISSDHIKVNHNIPTLFSSDILSTNRYFINRQDIKQLFQQIKLTYKTKSSGNVFEEHLFKFVRKNNIYILLIFKHITLRYFLYQ